ncbi:MAG: hypothetical protein IKW02_03210 [Clostridia bacterium]|nr:hypothetical protein [Clostridia bacterium]
MNPYIMLLLMQSISMLMLYLGKKLQLGIKPTASNMFQANLASAVVACVCLWAANGFKVNYNPTVLVFSACYGTLATFSLFFMIYSYSRISITLSAIISTSGSIITPLLFGVIFGGEPLSLKLVASAVLILTAAILPVAKDVFKQTDIRFVWFLVVYFIFSGLPNILNKIYTQNPNTTDELSYFFLTNVFMFIICLTGVVTIYLKNRKSVGFERVSTPILINSSTRTILSLFTSYLSVAALALLDVSLYSVLTASLGLLGNALISNFIFKEKLSNAGKISVALAILSFVVGS